MSKPFLSLVIPVYNEAQRLPQAIKKVDAFVHQNHFETEVLIVENGSSDGTLSIAQSLAQTRPFVRVFDKQRGKGLAVKRGMLEAKEDYRIMCDVDFSMPLNRSSLYSINLKGCRDCYWVRKWRRATVEEPALPALEGVSLSDGPLDGVARFARYPMRL